MAMDLSLFIGVLGGKRHIAQAQEHDKNKN